MFKHFLTALILLISASSFGQMPLEEVKSQIDLFASKQQVAISALIDRDYEALTHASGLADKEHRIPVKTDDLFEIGSASKMFTAIAILQLIEQGKFTLETPVSGFFPSGKLKNLANYKGENYWDKITVAMLLNHTSGIIDYLNVYGDDEKALKIFSVKGKIYTFDEITDLAIQHGDMNFIPGTTFKYSNTGYILLGEIISKTSGMPWRTYIQKNIFAKAGMKNTYFGSEIPAAAEKRKMKGYYNGKPSFMPPTLAGAAGEIVSNVNDLKKFLLAWHSGKLFSKPETLNMQYAEGYHFMYPDQTKALSYGYGVMKIDGFYGHGGQTFGFQSYVTYNPGEKQLYVFGVNDADFSAMQLFFLFAGLSL